MSDSPIHWKSAKLFPRFYDGIANAMVNGHCRRIAKFKFGFGYIDDTQDPPALLEIPDDLADIPNVLFEAEFTPEELSYSDGRILARCHMPQGSLTEPRRYSMTGIYDDQDNLLAATLDLPAWLVPSTRHTTYSYIDFPHVGDNPPEVLEGSAE